MINSKIDDCIKRVSLLKKDNKSELSEEVIRNAEIELNILFPKDFRILCNFYGYDYFHWDFYNFRNEEGVIEETKGWRESINLPNNYLVLSDDGTSAVLMKIDNEQSSIIWCALEDVLNICNGESMIYNPTIFPTFTDFYEFLLDEEEKSRAEDLQS